MVPEDLLEDPVDDFIAVKTFFSLAHMASGRHVDKTVFEIGLRYPIVTSHCGNQFGGLPCSEGAYG